MFHAVIKNAMSRSAYSAMTLAHYIESAKDGVFVKQVSAYRSNPTPQNKQALQAIIPSLAVEPHQLPAVRTQGSFSGIVCVDYDHVNNPAKFRDEIARSPHCHAALISVSGHGVAAFYRTEIRQFSLQGISSSELELHYGQLQKLSENQSLGSELYSVYGNLWKSIPTTNWGAVLELLVEKQYIPANYDVPVKDFPRLRFISDDPQAYFNSDSVPFLLSISVTSNQSPRSKKYTYSTIANIIGFESEKVPNSLFYS